MIFYPDGTQVDFSETLCLLHNQEPRISQDRKVYSNNGFITLKDWYKDLKKFKASPFGYDMLNCLFGLGEATIIFKDDSQVRVSFGVSGPMIEEYVDISENGDRLSIDRWGQTIKIININQPQLIDNTTGNKTSKGLFAQGVKSKEYIFGNWFSGYTMLGCIGQVITAEGDEFTGTFRVVLNKDARTYVPKSPYLRDLFGDKVEKENSLVPMYGIDNIAGIILGDGNILNKENKIVAMYRKSEQLDEFDMASELAAEQGRVDREKAAAKKAASEKAAITNKYGKKYADAFFAGKLIVGMPWSLVAIGLDAHSFKNFYTALLSYERESSSGTRECFSLIGYNFSHVGHMWIKNDVVESVTYY